MSKEYTVKQQMLEQEVKELKELVKELTKKVKVLEQRTKDKEYD